MGIGSISPEEIETFIYDSYYFQQVWPNRVWILEDIYKRVAQLLDPLIEPIIKVAIKQVIQEHQSWR